MVQARSEALRPGADIVERSRRFRARMFRTNRWTIEDGRERAWASWSIQETGPAELACCQEGATANTISAPALSASASARVAAIPNPTKMTFCAGSMPTFFNCRTWVDYLNIGTGQLRCCGAAHFAKRASQPSPPKTTNRGCRIGPAEVLNEDEHICCEACESRFPRTASPP